MGDPSFASGVGEGLCKGICMGIGQAELLRPTIVNVTRTFGVFLPGGVLWTPEYV